MIGTGINLTTHSADYRLHNKSQTTLTCIRRAACCTACCTATQCAKTSDLCQDSLVLHCEISHINTPAPVLGEESAAALSMQYTTHDTIQRACTKRAPRCTTTHHTKHPHLCQETHVQNRSFCCGHQGLWLLHSLLCQCVDVRTAHLAKVLHRFGAQGGVCNTIVATALAVIQ